MKKVIITACIMLGSTLWSSAQNALDFDGNNDFVQTNYTGVLGSLNRTFEAWVFINSSCIALCLLYCHVLNIWTVKCYYFYIHLTVWNSHELPVQLGKSLFS